MLSRGVSERASAPRALPRDSPVETGKEFNGRTGAGGRAELDTVPGWRSSCSQETSLRGLPGGHPTLAIRYCNVGAGLLDLGRPVSACEHFVRALSCALDNFDEGHHLVVGIKRHYARALRDLGEWESAREMLEQVLDWYCENRGEEHPDLASDRSVLARIHLERGDAALAAESSSAAIEAWQRARGPDHPDVACEQAHLAVAWCALGQGQEARELALSGSCRLSLPRSWKQAGQKERARERAAAALSSAGAMPEMRASCDKIERTVAGIIERA